MLIFEVNKQKSPLWLYNNEMLLYSRHHWIESATSFNHAYADTGLFLFYGSADPSKLTDLVKVLTSELKHMTESIEEVCISVDLRVKACYESGDVFLLFCS